jgi:hypothetical protein
MLYFAFGEKRFGKAKGILMGGFSGFFYSLLIVMRRIFKKLEL